MEAGVCGLPGRSAAGHVEVASPLLSDTATAPGTDLAHLILANASSMFLLLNFTKAAQCESEDEPYLSYSGWRLGSSSVISLVASHWLPLIKGKLA